MGVVFRMLAKRIRHPRYRSSVGWHWQLVRQCFGTGEPCVLLLGGRIKQPIDQSNWLFTLADKPPVPSQSLDLHAGTLGHPTIGAARRVAQLCNLVIMSVRVIRPEYTIELSVSHVIKPQAPRAHIKYVDNLSRTGESPQLPGSRVIGDGKFDTRRPAAIARCCDAGSSGRREA